MHRRSFLIAGLAPWTAACRRGAEGFDGYAFVANQEGKAVAVVDLGASFALIKHIGLNAAPTAILSHPNQPFIYVLTPETGVVHEISTLEMAVVRKVQAAPSAVAFRLAQDNSAIWVLSRESRSVIRIPLQSFRVESRISLPLEPVDFDVADFKDLCGVSFGSAGSVCLIDLTTGKPEHPVHVGTEIGSVRFRSGGEALLAANTADRILTVVQAPGGRVITHLPLAVKPENFCTNQDGGQLFITGEGMDAVVFVYPHRVPQVAETVLAGRAPGAMAASDDRLFVANPLTGDVSIFSIRNRRVMAVAAVGTKPSFVAVTPNDQFALVLNEVSGDMAVIRIPSIVPNRTKSAGLFTMIPVGSKPVCAVAKALA
ncbi:MAG: YncE family protein [Bryobacteraceae bacterium]